MFPEVIVPGDILGDALVLSPVVDDGFPSLHEFVDGFTVHSVSAPAQMAHPRDIPVLVKTDFPAVCVGTYPNARTGPGFVLMLHR